MANIPWGPAPSTVLYCDAAYIKSITNLPQNVDDALITNFIAIAQDKYVVFCIGSGVQYMLQSQIQNGTITASTINQTLLNNYIMPCLAYSCMVEALPFMWAQLKNKGITLSKSEFSDQITRDDLEYLIQQYRNISLNYYQRITQYLLENMNSFLNYLNPQIYAPGGNNGAQLIYPNISSYFYGIHLPQLGGNSMSREGYGFGMSIEQYWERFGNRWS